MCSGGIRFIESSHRQRNIHDPGIVIARLYEKAPLFLGSTTVHEKSFSECFWRIFRLKHWHFRRKCEFGL